MILWVDAASGVSGDKLLAALLDAGAPESEVRAQLAGLALPDWRMETSDALRGGIRGLSVRVCSDDRTERTWAGIRSLLLGAPLAPATRALALAAFTALAEAEAAVHGVAVGDVHFHEVGAVDSIVDVVGSAAAVASLAPSEVVFSPLAIGGGSVRSGHGTLPVPAPATALLLEGVPCYGADETAGELTTPTGAALAVTFASSFGPMPGMTVRGTGHGAGSREVAGLPNVLRVLLGDPVPCDIGDQDVVLLETNVDHVAPELLAIAVGALLDAGALDVWQTPIVMKKGRAAVAVSVLCRPDDEDRLVARLVRETGTLGVRRRSMRRWVAEREHATVATSAGRLRVKRGAGHSRPEAADLERIARETGLSALETVRALKRAGDEA